MPNFKYPIGHKISSCHYLIGRKQQSNELMYNVVIINQRFCNSCKQNEYNVQEMKSGIVRSVSEDSLEPMKPILLSEFLED